MPQLHAIAMISSTVIDLPEHRLEAEAACQRRSVVPLMMEDLPPSDDDAIKASLKMVDEADIYVGIFGYRYGHIPKGHDISITEMEFNRATERGIPRLVFLMSKEHPVSAGQMELDDNDPQREMKRDRLIDLKKRLRAERVVKEFKSPAELRAELINALASTDVVIKVAKENQGNFHSDVAKQIPKSKDNDDKGADGPKPPYIAHRYSLLETKGVIGRQVELNLLTGWITGKHPNGQVSNARILSLVAVGGMGKSALTWKWFNEIAPNERPDLKGRLWWSFYESDAGWENFILRALAYVRNTTEEALIAERKKWQEELAEGKKAPYKPWDDQLIDILDKDAYLLALDGLERILIAYARMDAAHMDDVMPDKDNLQLRKTADTRAGIFLRRLAGVNNSRILITTRLRLADLETGTRDPLPGTYAYELRGLSDDDAVALWRESNVSGTQEELLRLFHTFENYPLLIRALAAEVADFRRAPRHFDAWRKANPDFDPFQPQYLQMTIAERKSHILKYALQGLTDAEKKVLETAAAFRMPATYDTLVALLVKKALTSTASSFAPKAALFETEAALDSILKSLENRGLVGWDRGANRYDLHPIVRGVTWSRLGEDDRRGVYTALQGHFAAVPDKYSGDDYINVERFEDLTPAVELYQALIGLGRYDDAEILFYNRLDNATLYRLSASRQRIELLEALFPDGADHLPRLSKPDMQGFTLNALALAYKVSGEPGRAAPLYTRSNDVDEQRGDQKGVAIGLCNLAEALRLSGSLREAAAAARQALVITRQREDRFQEAISLYRLGLTLAACGQAEEAAWALRRSLVSWQKQNHTQSEGLVQTFRAQAALWRGDAQAASLLADRAWELAHDARYEADFIRAARLQGAAALAAGGAFDFVEERLHHALGRARAVNLVEEELPALIGLAELARRRGQLDEARERLNEVWEPAKRGPYPLWHADAFNELAAVERAAGNTQAAIEAARQAYTYAWCDGISADGSVCYAYAPGLKAAKAHLDALGVQEKDYPKLPPFDESKFEPLPEVEINPKDEYWVDPATVEEI